MARKNKETQVVQIGSGTFVGKNAKKARKLLSSLNHWNNTFAPAQSKRGACPRQRPGSLK